MGYIFWEIYRCEKFWFDVSVRSPARTGCRGGGGEAGQPLGTRVLGQFFLARNHVVAQPAFLLAGNHISDAPQDKEQERAREKRRRKFKKIK